MLTISKQQALTRWNTIPEVLRAALFSDINADFIKKLCESEHIPPEKRTDIAGIAGYVLLGFLHPGDLADELKDEVGLNSQVCVTLANAINDRIFNPLRSDIDKIYEPPSKFGLNVGPKILQDVAPTMTGTPPPPSPFAPGWSRMTTPQPTVKLEPATQAPPMPGAAPTVPQVPAPSPIKPPATPSLPAAPATPAAPAQPSAAGATKGAMDEFARLSAMKGDQKTAGVKPAAEPLPVMLHQDTEFKSQQGAASFHLEPLAEKLGEKKPVPQMPKPAVLELGTTPQAQKPGPATTRVVHYTEYKSPSPESPVPPKIQPAPQGPRHVTEITAASAPGPAVQPEKAPLVQPQPVKPSAPPPPMPPKPPAPPAPQPAPTKPFTPPSTPKPPTTPFASSTQPTKPSPDQPEKIVQKDYL